MSSTNIIQGDDKAVVPTEGQTTDKDNNKQGTSTALKAEINLKINVVHDIIEPLAHSSSLSSLDELAARLEKEFPQKNIDKAVVIEIDENLNNASEKSENKSEEGRVLTQNLAKPRNSGFSKSMDNILAKASYNGEDTQAMASYLTSNPSTCTAIAYSSAKPRSSSLASLKKLLAKERERLEDEESFVTIEGCVKEKTTSTDAPTIFSRSLRTQNAIMESRPYTNAPPPPYEYSQYSPRNDQPGQRGRTPVPVYQVVYDTYGDPPPPQPPPRDASRAPPYRRTERRIYFEHVEDLFLMKEVRNQFVRKVYTILAVQLLFSFGFILFVTHTEKVKVFMIRLWPLMIVALISYVVLMIALFCYQQARRTFPVNFILLSLMTLAMAYMTAYISCAYQTKIVMLAMGSTAGICILVSLLACQNWFDVTQWGMVLCLAGIVIIIYGVIAIIITMLTGSKIAYLIYSCLVTLLFCAYLMYDTQQILGGRRVEMSPEEYILGAITLYVDVMIIFQHILFLISACR